mmetsp:Transcript_10801/g.24392  ORF Transcript_10801/g.24392 Transcript_10801/m.24392 type:complete len:144 (+) Transcript_10801:79-510(+)|eukprot:CAMPEP_0197907714 /NCGR_PEP_ID=MMETSP1439-20131203/65354_1 /TAXON_ID=66791 /ORGANISM="Gonyaulax spinifera, Strain CCMP409" /LENGTH=143 /DNA_ID=CAMNT_0043529163 /DNA_START=79 /DNA_END=510 /DNA_ORIENTATION=-
MKAAAVAFLILLEAAGAGAWASTGHPACQTTAAPTGKASLDDVAGATQLQSLVANAVAALPTLSFMLFRIAVAFRSIYDMSPGVLWRGVAFACITRCLAEGVFMSLSLLEVDFAALLATGVREFMHMYGLRLVLRHYGSCSEP